MIIVSGRWLSSYGACFGVELTIDNIAALYFTDRFGLGVTPPDSQPAPLGMMNLVARASAESFPTAAQPRGAYAAESAGCSSHCWARGCC